MENQRRKMLIKAEKLYLSNIKDKCSSSYSSKANNRNNILEIVK
jgi:hypothetical protein